LIFADLHLTGKDTSFVSTNHTYPYKTFTKMSILDSILTSYSNWPKEDKNVIIAGDVYHEKNIVYGTALTLFESFLNKFTDWNFIIINGNHDVCDQTENPITLLTALDEKFEHVTLVDYNQSKVIGQNNNILLIGWHRNMSQMIKEAVEMNPDVDTLISHFGVNEASLSTGIYGVSKIKFSQLRSKFNLIILGHYHKPQELKSNDKMLYYVGSLIQENWNEVNEDKRYLILDDNTMEVSSILVEGYDKYILMESDDLVEIKKQMESIENLKRFKVKTNSPEIHEYCLQNKILCFYKNKLEENQVEVKTIDNEDIYEGYLLEKKPNLSKEEIKKYMEIKKMIVDDT